MSVDDLRDQRRGLLVAVLATAGATLLRGALDPLLGDHVPFITFYAATAVTVWFGGIRPALLGTLLGAAAACYFFVPPRYSFQISTGPGFLTVPLFVLVSLTIALGGGAMRNAEIRARRAEFLARQHGELLRITLASIGDAVVTTDVGGVVTYLNPVAEALTGWTTAEAQGQPLTAICQLREEGTRRPADNPVEKVLKSGQVVGLANHTVLVSKDGTERMIDDSAAPIRDDRGDVVGVVLVCRDITQRKRADEALRESEAILRAFSDHAPVFLGVVEPTGDGDVLHLYDNSQACRFFGVEPGATTNRRALRDLGGEPAVVAEWLRRYRESEETNGPVGFEAASVSRWLAATVCPIGRGPSGRTRFCYIAQDVTERRRVAEALRESEKRFRQLADAMPQIVYVSDPTGAVEFCNRRWHDYTGLTSAETADLPRVVHPDDLEDLARRWAAARAAGTLLSVEYRLRRAADGQYRWFLTRAVPVRGADGRVVNWYGTSTDIHEVRMAQEALREADRRKDDFLALLAHELRNPLAPLSNGLQVMLLAEEGGAVAGEGVAAVRAMMVRQLAQLVRIVDDLLDVSRITRNKMELRLQRVELAAVVQSAVETSRPLLDERGHDLTVDLPGQPVLLDADLTRLAQVFANLLNNSAKYTPPGGRVSLRAERRGPEVVVTVRDTGIGIPQEALGRIFDMFSQVERDTEKTTGGLGIGLSLVKGLVGMHGGTIEADSQGLNQGSVFTVRLPAAATEPGAAEPPGKVSQGPTGGRRILVVDDNRDSASSLAILLRLAGNDVRIAHDGLQAIEMAGEFFPDLILMDIGMPRLDGLEAAERIRQQPWGQSIQLLALTGWGDAQTRAETRDVGFDGHLTKPVDYPALVQLLRDMQGSGRPGSRPEG